MKLFSWGQCNEYSCQMHIRETVTLMRNPDVINLDTYKGTAPQTLPSSPEKGEKPHFPKVNKSLREVPRFL